MTFRKIVSGGQTGVDQGALDAALAANFACGGWAPGDRTAEDGIIPERYPLIPLPNGGYRQRTRLNVSDSDGTAILYYESLKGGTRLTRNLCALLKRPYVLIDAREMPDPMEAAQLILKFIEENNIETLNVAGPRLSGWAGGYRFAADVVGGVISRLASGLQQGEPHGGERPDTSPKPAR
jgi:Circularly permutated YpsA SLOG family